MKRFFLVGILALVALTYPTACFASDAININIVAGTDKASSHVTASGQVSHIITAKERSSFGITDNALKNAIGKYWGKNPNDAWVCSPARDKDLYSEYNWEQVQTVMTVKSAQIIAITSSPVIVATRVFTNYSSKPASFMAVISEEVTDTSTSSWSDTSKIEIKQKFNYGVAVAAETSLAYTHTWGQSKSETKTNKVGSAEGVTVMLDPNESVNAQLTASKGVMKVRIVYSAYLTGQAAVNYNPTFKDHHFFGLGIQNIMNAAKLPSTMEFTEDIEVGYYSNAKVELRDSVGTLKHSSLAIIKPI